MITRIKTFLRIVYTTKNWIWASLIYLGLINKTEVVFRNGFRFRISGDNWKKFMDHVNFFRVFPAGKVSDKSVNIKYEGKDLIFYFGRWGPNIVNEVFGTNSYKKTLGEFDINGRDVIDLGASIGDSIIFFSIMGARKVYGFEPFPPFYALAVRNIKKNNLENSCQVVKSAVGAQKGDFLVDSTYDKMLGVYSEKFETGEKIPISTLEEIVENYKINKGVLKLDCEGCEYEVILNADNKVLRHFDYILMEYHYGFKTLMRKLEKAGFQVKYTKPTRKFLEEKKSEYGNIEIGYLTAEKI